MLDRLETMPPQDLARLHGATRYHRAVRDPRHRGTEPAAAPEPDEVLIGGVPVGRSSRVTMRPGARRADAQDLFLAGREATVQAVLHDLDGNVHVAVTADRDEAADLQRSRGRYLYFSAEELEPIRAAEAQYAPHA